MKAIHAIAFILTIIGGLNWGLVGINSGWNLVALALGTGTLASIVYILVGLSAIWLVVTHKKDCKCCDKSMASAQPNM